MPEYESESKPTYIICHGIEEVFEGVQQLVDRDAPEIHLVGRIETLVKYEGETEWEYKGWYSHYVKLDADAIKVFGYGGRSIIREGYLSIHKHIRCNDREFIGCIDVCVTDDPSDLFEDSWGN
jgi:hypothetical protein